MDPLNLNARFFRLSLGAKYDTRLPPWDMALGLLRIQIYANSSQQLIKHEAS